MRTRAEKALGSRRKPGCMGREEPSVCLHACVCACLCAPVSVTFQHM